MFFRGHTELVIVCVVPVISISSQLVTTPCSIGCLSERMPHLDSASSPNRSLSGLFLSLSRRRTLARSVLRSRKK